MIRTKSIYDPDEEEDGLRLLVTRYWPRGVKKNRSHLWLRDLGPGPSLIKAWKSGEVTWPEFRELYLEEFGAREKREALAKAVEVVGRAESGRQEKTVTLLCACRDSAMCHRSILKEMIEARLKKR